MIIRDIYIKTFRIFDPINIVEGTHKYPIRLNVKDVNNDLVRSLDDYTCKAYSKSPLGTFVCDATIVDTNDAIVFSPPSGFFTEGENWLQIEIADHRASTARLTYVYTFPMKVIVDHNLFNDTVHDAEEIDATEEMKTNYVYIRQQVNVNTEDIADIKEQIENVNSGIEVTEAEYEAIRASSEYDPDATYFINDLASPEKEVYLTRAQYNALRQTSEYSPSTKYFITDEDGVVGAEAVSYGGGSVADAIDGFSEVIEQLSYRKIYTWSQKIEGNTRTNVVIQKSSMGINDGRTVIPLGVDCGSGFIQGVVTSQSANEIHVLLHSQQTETTNNCNLQYMTLK